MARLKVMTILGTRPEIIRLSRVIAALDRDTEHVVVHTGQNYDFELSQVFFDDLGLRPPDRYLSAAGQTAAETIGQVIIAADKVIGEMTPDAVLILGDTNSCLAAIAAKRRRVPVFHMEAGNRCFDFNVPEEINRRIIDHVSDFNLVYTEHARRNLLAEGIHPRRIYLTGSPMREVLDANRPAIDGSDVLARLGLAAGGYFLVSMHRAENVDVPAHLTQLLEVMNRLCERHGLPIVVSTHPRTKSRLEALKFSSHGSIRFLPPFGYHDYVKLQLAARCTLSDSGTISEESSILGFPAVTMRVAMERPEAMDSGHIVLTGRDSETILQAIDLVVESRDHDRQQPIAQEYEITNISHRVVKLIMGTAKLSHDWDGIKVA